MSSVDRDVFDPFGDEHGRSRRARRSRNADARSDTADDGGFLDNDPFAVPAPRWSILAHWDWFMLVSLAWLLFELFAEPVLSVIVASCRFGWNDFLNGLWLWRRDARTGRGRTCLLFYAATGLWRTTVLTFGLTIAGLILVAVLAEIHPQWFAGQGQQEFETTAGVSMLIVCQCFILSSVTTWVAVIAAKWCGLRIWIDSSIRINRRQNQWPPRPSGKNQLSRVVTTSVIFLAVCAIILPFILVGVIAGPRGPQNVHPLVVVLPMLVGIVGSAVLLLGGREWILSRIAARHASECWEPWVTLTDADFFDHGDVV